MANSSLKLFFVYMENNTDRQDDEVWKIRAKTKPSARKLALNHPSAHRFTVRSVMTRKGFKRSDPEWHALLWGVEPEITE